MVVEAVGIDISKCSMRWYDRPVGLSDIADVGDHTVSSDRSLSTDTFGPTAVVQSGVVGTDCLVSTTYDLSIQL